MNKAVVICADDFGMSKGVNEAIFELAREGKIHAVSVLIDQRATYPTAFDQLANMPALDLGLHLDFYKVLPGMNLEVALRVFFSTDLKEKLADLIRDQLAKFHSAFSSFPTFIDSHQNVHILPPINTILISVLKELNLEKKVYVRNTFSGSFFSPTTRKRLAKKAILDTFGLFAKLQYESNKIKTNDSFLGILNYDKEFFSSEFFQSQLMLAKGFAIFYVHPALTCDDLIDVDPYREGRLAEFNVLKNQP